MDSWKKKLSDIIKTLQEIASDIIFYLGDFLINALNKFIIENAMPEEFHPFIDALDNFLQYYKKNGNDDCKGEKKEKLIKLAMVASTKFLFIWTYSDKISDMVLPVVEPFFDVLFDLIDINNVLETKDADHASKIEIAGLRARLKSTDIFIKRVLKEEHVDEPALQGLISHVDIHIGVDEIGKLKCIIERQMIGTRDDWEKCLKNLHLLMRIYIMRNGLLLRLIACLKLKGYSRSTCCVLESLVEQEKEDAQIFLKFFSLPSKNNVGVIALFDPLEHEELATLLEEIGLPQRPKLDKMLHNNVFVINACTQKKTQKSTEKRPDACAEEKNISIVRSYSLLHTIYGMATGVNCNSVHIQFRFTTVKDSFDLFYIQSFEYNEYLYMTENSGCMYAKQLPKSETAAQWKILEVHEEEGDASSFAICAKKWPGKFLYLDKSYWETACRLIGFAYGQRNKERQTNKCLFKVGPGAPFPNGFSDNILVPRILLWDIPMYQLMQVYKPVPQKRTEQSETSSEEVSIQLRPLCIVPASIKQLTVKDREGNKYTKVCSTTETDSCKKEMFETINIFFEKKGISVQRDIEKIKNHVSENQDTCKILKKIKDNLSNFDGDNFTEQMMIGLVEMISINFELFQEEFLHGSIRRQILRVCAIVMSCIWNIKDMDVFICGDLVKSDENCRHITKNIASLQRFASFLREIEGAENILQNDINDLKINTAFSEELECLSGLKEKAKSDPKLVLSWVKVSILQQTILWQMYAVAKLPGHSDKVANHLRRVIILQRRNDVKFLEECKIATESNMTIANKYKNCLCFESHMNIPTNETETDKNEKSRCSIT